MSQCLKWVCRGRSLCCKGVSWLLGFYFLHTDSKHLKCSWFWGGSIVSILSQHPYFSPLPESPF